MLLKGTLMHKDLCSVATFIFIFILTSISPHSIDQRLCINLCWLVTKPFLMRWKSLLSFISMSLHWKETADCLNEQSPNPLGKGVEVSSDTSVCAHFRVCLKEKDNFYNRWVTMHVTWVSWVTCQLIRSSSCESV